MKKIFFALSLSIITIFSSCIKNEPVVYEQSTIEFDAATWNANSVGVTYPILARIPAYGAATGTGSPTLTRTSGTIKIRVNILGAQKPAATDFTYVVDPTSTAIAGTHFTSLSGTGTIPANSSFGFIDIPVLNPGATSGSKILILQLTGNASFKTNFNYEKVGLSISQL
jgi:hypothetical protein